MQMTRRWEGESNRGMIKHLFYRLAKCALVRSNVRFGSVTSETSAPAWTWTIHHVSCTRLFPFCALPDPIRFGRRSNSLKLGTINHRMMGSLASLPCSRPSTGAYIGSTCVNPRALRCLKGAVFHNSHPLTRSRVTPVYRSHPTTLNGPNASRKESKAKAQCLAGSSDFHRSRLSSPWSHGTMRPRT